MRFALVSNARSGSADPEVVADARAALGALGPVESVEPASIEEFEDQVRAAARGVDVVVVAGGDGTLNCAVNALGDRLGEVSFALLPMGTGNDLARTLEVPDDPLDAARGLVDATRRTLDVGRAAWSGGTRLFVNACMGGFPVDVDAAVDPRLKEKLGPLAFWLGGLKATPSFEPFSVSLPGRSFADCYAVGIGNGATVGGGIRLWPSADPGDGDLDLCVLTASSGAQALKMAIAAKAGRHGNEDGVHLGRGRTFEVESDPPIEFNVDGELVGVSTPVTFSINTQVEILVPRSGSTGPR